MEQVVIDSIESYERTQRWLSHLLSKEGSASTAVALAEGLVSGPRSRAKRQTLACMRLRRRGH